jgi:hypothetical protein
MRVGVSTVSEGLWAAGGRPRSALANICQNTSLYVETLREFDVRGSVHHSAIHKQKSNKLQQCIKILLFHIYMKPNMFRATHRPSPGA